MRIFVTGSTGFIGSHFLRAALAAGHEIIGLRYPGTQPVIPIPESDRLTWVDGDLNTFFSDPSAFRFQLSDFSSTALIQINPPGVFAGSLPKKALAMVIEWTVDHRDDLIHNWEEAKAGRLPKPVSPLE